MEKRKSSDILRRAMRLIRKPEKWTQGTWAVDHNGAAISAYSPLACKFCADGALLRVVGPRGSDLTARKYLTHAVEGLFPRFHNIIEFNDSIRGTHDGVLECFKHAIQLAEKAGD